MHGTTMMFLFAVPVMQAMAVYLVPLMVGARTIAFPRMNAYAYWVYLFGGADAVRRRFALNIGPDAGWFSYVPLAGPALRAGQAQRLLGAADHVHRAVGAARGGRPSSRRSFKLRAPGMTLNRMPLFVWAMLVHVVHGHVRDAVGDAAPARR